MGKSNVEKTAEKLDKMRNMTSFIPRSSGSNEDKDNS